MSAPRCRAAAFRATCPGSRRLSPPRSRPPSGGSLNAEANTTSRSRRPLAPYRKRLETWKQDTLFAAGKPDTATIAEASARFDLAQTLETTGAPMMRLLAVLEGNR